MKQKLLSPLNNKNGFLLPYILFLVVIVLNIFLLTTIIYLNEKKLYNDKINYYQMLVIEERIKRHVKEKIAANNVKNLENEKIIYNDSYVLLTYLYDFSSNSYNISVKIYYKNLYQSANIIYYLKTNELTYINR